MIDVLLDGFATWRLVRLIAQDEITAPARERAIDWTLAHRRPRLRELLTCQHCLGVWCAAVVLALGAVPGGRRVRDLLAVAGISSLLHDLLRGSAS